MEYRVIINGQTQDIVTFKKKMEARPWLDRTKTMLKNMYDRYEIVSAKILKGNKLEFEIW